MHKVLIVEDEIFVRMGLKMSIEWEKNGLILIGEASNGRQALDIMKVNTPDIVITDIKMPEMDGVQLIKEVSRDYPYVKCLVLSNYDDFDLVKEAMKSGAIDYFLKVTIETEKLVDTLRSLCDKLEQENNSRTNLFKMQEALSDHRLVIKRKFIEDLSDRDVPLSTVKNRIDRLGLKLYHEKGTFIYFSILNYQDILEERFDSDNNLFIFSIVNIVEEVINHHLSGEVFEYNGDFIAIMTGDNGVENNRARFVAEHIKTAVKEYLNIEMNVVYGFQFDNIETLRSNLVQINSIRLLVFYEESGTIILKDDASFSNADVNELYRNIKKELGTYVNYCDTERIIDCYDRLFESLKTVRPEPLMAKRVVVSSVNYLLDELMQSNSGEIGGDILNAVKEMENCRTFSETKSVCGKFLTGYSNLLQASNSSKYRDEILKVIEYIHNNYSSKISLEGMAKYVNMNKSYFSRLFKQETGEQFQYFVIRVRMEKARELILSTDRKMSAIAADVGFTDIFYFNKVFKNYFNVTPGEYKKQKHIL